MEKDTNKQAYQETKLIKNNFEKSNIEMEKEFWKSVKECLIAGDRKSVIEAINFKFCEQQQRRIYKEKNIIIIKIILKAKENKQMDSWYMQDKKRKHIWYLFKKQEPNYLIRIATYNKKTNKLTIDISQLDDLRILNGFESIIKKAKESKGK